MRAALTVFISCLVLTACQTVSLEDTSAALLTGDKAASQKKIAEVMADHLGRPSVTLSKTAFVNTPDVIIERAFAGPIADGRRMDRPDHFKLMTHDKNCFLYHEESKTLLKLDTVSCAVAVERPAP